MIGLCRFSYPAIGGFQVDFDDFQEKLDYLYAPTRMNERFATFETITLPPLQAQTDPGFTFVVVIGESLPDESYAFEINYDFFKFIEPVEQPFGF